MIKNKFCLLGIISLLHFFSIYGCEYKKIYKKHKKDINFLRDSDQEKVTITLRLLTPDQRDQLKATSEEFLNKWRNKLDAFNKKASFYQIANEKFLKGILFFVPSTLATTAGIYGFYRTYVSFNEPFSIMNAIKGTGAALLGTGLLTTLGIPWFYKSLRFWRQAGTPEKNKTKYEVLNDRVLRVK
jgi:hypothetical protein